MAARATVGAAALQRESRYSVTALQRYDVTALQRYSVTTLQRESHDPGER